jgi:hypothetical protein
MRLRLCSALVLLACAPEGARAADWYTGSPANQASRPTSSFDLSLSGTSQSSVHGVAIGTFSPYGSLDESGMRLRVAATLGTFTYTATTKGVGQVRGDQAIGTFLVGHEWVMPNMTAALWGGLDIWRNSLDKVDPNNKTEGTAFGFKAGADLYVNPTSYTMASANLTFSSAHQSYYSRFKAGMAVSQNVFIGPELVALGDSFSQQWRAGAHLSGFKVGPLQFGLAGGYMNDRVRGSGGYGTFDTRILF